MADTRCDTTELLVDQCACPQHRGGRTPQEEVDAERQAVRARLLADPASGLIRWFRAHFPGACHSCGETFPIGTAIRRTPTQDGFAYVADCCAKADP
ncbi:hypothetical protein [Saccharothrix sp. HUAS TT1]|uniref:hypothetical protein n=1 Tax=unclassified Saccharothrix TaxID=2593673 RepID=UPI00345BC7C2